MKTIDNLILERCKCTITSCFSKEKLVTICNLPLFNDFLDLFVQDLNEYNISNYDFIVRLQWYRHHFKVYNLSNYLMSHYFLIRR